MFNKLPPNIIGLIYEYDNTYKYIFNVTLTELKLNSLVNPNLNNHDTIEWLYRISKWKHKEPIQIYIPTIKYNYLQQIETSKTIQNLIEAITYKVNTYKENTLYSILITTANTKYCNSEAIRIFKVLL